MFVSNVQKMITVRVNTVESLTLHVVECSLMSAHVPCHNPSREGRINPSPRVECTRKDLFGEERDFRFTASLRSTIISAPLQSTQI